MDPPPQPLSQNVKTNRGFYHPITGELLCPAGLDYKDAEQVFLAPLFSFDVTYWVCFFSVRKKLANGDIGVSGDQWPLLLYEDQKYDPDEPWDGLFRCKLLVWVSFIHYLMTRAYFGVNRRINISSHHPVPSRKKWRQLDWGMLVYMGWLALLQHLWLT